MSKTLHHVNNRSQITLDEEVRRQLKIEPGMVAHQRVVGDHLEIIFLPAPHNRSLFGVFHDPDNTGRVTTSDDLEEAVSATLAADTAQRGDRGA